MEIRPEILSNKREFPTELFMVKNKQKKKNRRSAPWVRSADRKCLSCLGSFPFVLWEPSD